MVRFFHVARAYGAREVLADVTLSLGGEPAVIAGPAGAGKSVLLRLMCGLEAPTRGWITVDGLPLAPTASDVLAAHRRRLAIVPQHSLLIEDRSVIQNVALALELQEAFLGEVHERAGEALARVGIAGLADRSAGSLSAGERRLVCLARALARDDSKLLIADEPAAGLDPVGRQRVGRLLAEQAAQGATVIVASQEPGLLGLGEHRVLFLEQGRVAWDSSGAAASEAS
ncbi:MAG: ATP-binding cassette domain-containing protein [Candidatus Binatia bacterium]|nr:ATP-binding cassette domain-containing protein [Candidatus Binatia bacterium]